MTPSDKLYELTYCQQQCLGTRRTSGDTMNSKSLLGPVPAQEQVLEEAFLFFLCHYQHLQTGGALCGPPTCPPKCDPTAFSYLFPSSSAATACSQVLSSGCREAPRQSCPPEPEGDSCRLTGGNGWGAHCYSLSQTCRKIFSRLLLVAQVAGAFLLLLL